MHGYYGKLGMDAVFPQHSNIDTFLTIKNIWSDVVVAAWNKQVPMAWQIHIGDKIVCLNGCTDGRSMLTHAEAGCFLQLTVLKASAARARTKAIDAAKRDMRAKRNKKSSLE